LRCELRSAREREGCHVMLLRWGVNGGGVGHRGVGLRCHIGVFEEVAR
jgi:hypothetical protein